MTPQLPSGSPHLSTHKYPLGGNFEEIEAKECVKCIFVFPPRPAWFRAQDLEEGPVTNERDKTRVLT